MPIDDVLELFLGAQLAVGYVNEVGAAVEPTEGVPGFDVGGLIVAVTRINMVVNGNGPVVGDTQGVDQLLEIIWYSGNMLR